MARQRDRSSKVWTLLALGALVSGALIIAGSGPAEKGALASGRVAAALIAETPSAYLPLVERLPAPTSTATVISGPPWLQYVNRFRAEANVHGLSENAAWSNGGWLHGRYMVKNDYIGHDEDPGNPWYTPEGRAAAQNGNVFVSSWSGTSDETAIDFWMRAPFHAIGIIDPQLYTTGYGGYRESIGLWQFGATFDVLRGLGPVPPGTAYPLPYPRDGGQTWLLSYSGGEWPDPLTACPGYSAPTGPPIMLQLGSGGVTPNVTAHSFSGSAGALASCLFDETSYTNPNGSTQNTGRAVLNSRDAIVIMPKNPLQIGHSYTASVTANGGTTTWSFTVTTAPLREDQPAALQFELR